MTLREIAHRLLLVSGYPVAQSVESYMNEMHKSA